MCSIFKYKQTVGRNFDYEISYDEQLIVMEQEQYGNEYAIIGICTGAVNNYPLLYDGMNEYGLVCGGLAFVNNAKYFKYQEDKLNIPSFDFTFQVLANNKDVGEVKEWLKDVNIWCEPFSDDFPNSDLHWFIADKNESIIVEQTIDGLDVYDGDVMTNNPPYPLQLENYLDEKEYVGQCCYKSDKWFSKGMETDNLQGGYTSEERFIRLSYLKEKVEQSNTLSNNITESFHLLSSVEQIFGATSVGNMYEYTIYSVVYDMQNGMVWVKTYDRLCPTNYMITEAYERIKL